MDRNTEIKKGLSNVPTQTFNGKTYYLYDNENYYSKGRKRLHRVVWEYYKGKIPKGYHIHHIDGDTKNNDISNLSLIEASLHLRFEGKKRFKNNPDFAKEFHAKGIEKAKEWHKSDDGKKWHSEHGKKTWINKKYIKKVCQECGNEYKTRHSGISKFCHNNCKAKSNRRSRKLRSDGI